MASLDNVVRFCNDRVDMARVPDFPGASNGLQVANSGRVSKIGAAVDAGLEPFKIAVRRNIDFLIVHHGLFWTPPFPIVDHNYQKLKVLLDGDCALYSVHLPLDCHSEIGNNALITKALGLTVEDWFLPHADVPIGAIARFGLERPELDTRLRDLFTRVTAVEFGGGRPERIAIVSGSGASAVDELKKVGVDTLITGELKQHHFNMAQELGLNLYCCGHYATETFGVRALAREVAEKFDVDWEFIETECPL